MVYVVINAFFNLKSMRLVKRRVPKNESIRVSTLRELAS